MQLATDRFEGGLTPEMDLRQAEAELRRVEVVVFDLERLIALKENELSVLLGRNPGAIPRGRTIDEQKLPAAVPAGLPSDAARPPAGHPRGRAGPRRRHREHRPGQGPPLPAHRPHRLLRLHQHGVRHPLRRSEQVLEHHRQPAAAHLQRRQEPAPRGDHRVAAAPDPLRIRGARSCRPSARPRTPSWPTARPASSAPPRPSAWGPSARWWSWPSCATAAASRPTSRCWTPSARSSRPSWTRPQTIGSNLISLVRLYKALGGGWPTGLPLHDGEAEGASTESP